MLRRWRDGFTLIELLIVIVVIGIIAAILIPNLLNALQRGRQKRTMGDMHAIGVAVAVYEADRDSYPIVAAANQPISVTEPMMVPTYLKEMVDHDGWGRDFRYRTDAVGTRYTLTSYAKNGVASGPASGETTNFNDDIVLADGAFVTWPEGRQN